jgi:hypothetical protein
MLHCKIELRAREKSPFAAAAPDRRLPLWGGAATQPHCFYALPIFVLFRICILHL